MASKTTKKQQTFEDGLNQLEQLANRMETPNLPLEELMKLYEDGVALSRELSQKLMAMKASMQEVKQGSDGSVKLQKSDLEKQTNMVDMLNAED